MKKLGVDCGNVILYHYVGIVPDAFESLQAVVRSGCFENIYIVSRASLIGRAYFLFRLRRLDFWRKTGVPRENIYFCRKDSQKIDICKKLGITDFIDDRLPVLRHMESLEHRFAFSPKKKDIKKYPEVLARTEEVRSWNELEPMLPSLYQSVQ